MEILLIINERIRGSIVLLNKETDHAHMSTHPEILGQGLLSPTTRISEPDQPRKRWLERVGSEGKSA